MEKQVNQLAAIENLAVLSDEDASEAIAIGCSIDTPEVSSAIATTLSVEDAAEVIAVGCVVDDPTVRR